MEPWKEESTLALIRLAKAEDMGPDDATSRLLVHGDAMATARLIQKQPGVFCGAELVPVICGEYDARLVYSPGADGLGTISGPLRSILSAERIVLNFVQRLSGIATLTRRFVDAVAGTRARIVDTRKTLPGWRNLDKWAVRVGGGHNHRMGLYDGVLIKDNHVAGVPDDRLRTYVQEIVDRSRAEAPTRFIQCEVQRLSQLREVLAVRGLDSVLLDNMLPALMAEGVAMRDAARVTISLEASGGVTLATVAEIARSGVDRISVGALTHSPPALDISLKIEAR